MSERLTTGDLQILCTPFPPEDVKFLQGNAYIKEEAITVRIESVDPAWSFEITASGFRDKRTYATGKLTIKGSTRGNVGMGYVVYKKGKQGDPHAEANDAEKSAATDCLKRCARLFGVGRYILELKDVNDSQGYTHWLNNDTSQHSPEPAIRWPSEAAITFLYDKCVETLILHPDETSKDMASAVGIQKAYDLSEVGWGQFPSGGDAYRAVKEAIKQIEYEDIPM